MPQAEVQQMIGAEVRARLASRVRWEHVAAYEVLQDPFRLVAAQSGLICALDQAAQRRT